MYRIEYEREVNAKISLYCSGNTITVQTDASKQYSSVYFAPYTHHEYVLFDVMACQDVLLGLYQNQVAALDF